MSIDTRPLPAAHTTPPARPTREQQLLSEVEQVFRRFMHYPHEHAFTVATLLVAHTHLRGPNGEFLPRVTPRGYTGSLLPGCGKTMDLELKTLMSFNGQIVLEPTEPGVISLIHNDKATVGLTEIDLLFGNRGTSRAGLKAAINGGYRRGATVDRERGGETEKRNIHGPMFLDGKNLRRFLQEDGPFDTVRTRSIVTALERKPAHVKLDKYNSERHEPRLRQIAARLTLWGRHHGQQIVRLNVERWMDSIGLDNRDAEIWTVLFQVAAHVGGDWPARVTAAAKALVLGVWGEDEAPVLSPAQDLLEAVRAVYGPGETFLPTRVILQRVMGRDGWWTGEWSSPRAASMGLAAELGTFGIEATREYVDGRQERGYALVALLDVESDDDDWGDPPAEDVESWNWDELDDED